MPTFKVWVKRTVQGPNGTLEIGLGGTHNISCEPHQVARERFALYKNYKAEVDRLIACELSGEPATAPTGSVATGSAATGAAATGAAATGSAATGAAATGSAAKASTEKASTATGSHPAPVIEPSPGHRDELEASPEYSPISHERSRQVLAELQERLAQRSLHPETSHSPLLEGLFSDPEKEPT